MEARPSRRGCREGHTVTRSANRLQDHRSSEWLSEGNSRTWRALPRSFARRESSRTEAGCVSPFAHATRPPAQTLVETSRVPCPTARSAFRRRPRPPRQATNFDLHGLERPIAVNAVRASGWRNQHVTLLDHTRSYPRRSTTALTIRAATPSTIEATVLLRRAVVPMPAPSTSRWRPST
jgi:hypothetical protein